MVNTVTDLLKHINTSIEDRYIEELLAAIHTKCIHNYIYRQNQSRKIFQFGARQQHGKCTAIADKVRRLYLY
jgi:uncharacterized protein YqgV (UPF0045/DUF77 family)